MCVYILYDKKKNVRRGKLYILIALHFVRRYKNFNLVRNYEINAENRRHPTYAHVQ